MSTTTATRTATRTATTTTSTRLPLLRTGVAAGAAATVATTTVAAVAKAAGVSFADSTGQSIPLLGFAQVTFFCVLLGVAMAAGVRRWASQPRRTFTRTAWALAILSCVAPTLIGLDTASVATLVADHLVAAAIVIPWIGSRLTR